MRSPNHLTTLTCLLIVLTAVGNAWGERQSTRDDGSEDLPRPVNQDSWGDEERNEDSWTWFGMGYESRTPGAGNLAATGNRKNDN